MICDFNNNLFTHNILLNLVYFRVVLFLIYTVDKCIYDIEVMNTSTFEVDYETSLWNVNEENDVRQWTMTPVLDGGRQRAYSMTDRTGCLLVAKGEGDQRESKEESESETGSAQSLLNIMIGKSRPRYIAKTATETAIEGFDQHSRSKHYSDGRNARLYIPPLFTLGC